MKIFGFFMALITMTVFLFVVFPFIAFTVLLKVTGFATVLVFLVYFLMYVLSWVLIDRVFED